MEVSGAAGGAAKRKREATPDADLCCDICHEVRCRHHYWREVALAARDGWQVGCGGRGPV